MYHQISQKTRLNDYPIVEVYLAINANFAKVIESEQSQYGLIHTALKRKEQ
jgi:hypothetical protein